MRLLKETKIYREDAEADAIAAIQKFRDDANEGGYTVKKASYSYKVKKAKGEVIDEGFQVEVQLEYNTLWGEE